MIYARVHDQTVADDYFTAMTRVEQRLALEPPAAESAPTSGNQTHLWVLLDQLAAPTAELPARIAIVAQLKTLLAPTASLVDAPLPAAHEHERQPPV
jgi:hypothetical protein